MINLHTIGCVMVHTTKLRLMNLLLVPFHFSITGFLFFIN